MSSPPGEGDPRDAARHFKFGRNWRAYARHIDAGRIAEAERDMTRLFGSENLAGRRFLDIGSGSGLHSVAATRLGCARVVATDIDPDSVATSRATLSAFAPGQVWECRQISVFDMTAGALGRFDVVYSWGALHHTGAMWDAIRSAAAMLDDGGLLAIALYQKTPCCGFWLWEKRIYSRSPAIVQYPVRVLYMAAASLRHLLAGRRPMLGPELDTDRGPTRGMRAWSDAHDWLGGYPYESASPEEVTAFVSGLGFSHVRSLDIAPSIGLFGSGCAQYLFRKEPSGPAAPR